MMRVQIPAYTDRWMMGDRYGTVENIRKRKSASMDERYRLGAIIEVAYVRLDKSGKKIKVILSDCTVLPY